MTTCNTRRSLRGIDGNHDAAATASVRRANTKARRRKANPQKRDAVQPPRPDNREVRISAPELEFADAMQAYKLRSGRLFPTWSEVLEVLRSLGYQKTRQLPADDLAGCLPGLCTRPSDIVSTLIDDATIDATINGWVQALIRRDKETGEHTRRVTEMTMKLARAMNVDEADLIHIRRGALLHDIGKIGIPDAILHKPGPLTDDQMEVVRRHPTYAYEWLAPIAALRPALAIPYCHHERWDGTGYPRGLKGEQIPLSARMFAVVDTWDALGSDRPYRKAWQEEEVRNHLCLLAGTHFDSEVVANFLRLTTRETAQRRMRP